MAIFMNTKLNVVIVIVGALLVAPILATEFVVGDEKGWGPNFDYQTWAKGKEFYVGDKIVFNYRQGSHNVLRVNQTEFQDCKAAENTIRLTTGNDAITLSSPGKKWYICGFPNHCSSLNMKLAITVLPKTGAPASSPALAPSTSPSYIVSPNVEAPTSSPANGSASGAPNIGSIASMYYNMGLVVAFGILGLVMV